MLHARAFMEGFAVHWEFYVKLSPYNGFSEIFAAFIASNVSGIRVQVVLSSIVKLPVFNICPFDFIHVHSLFYKNVINLG